jgi:thymidylate synthase
MSESTKERSGNHIVVPNADSAYTETMSLLLKEGRQVSAGESLSVGSERDFREILNFSVQIENPSEKLVFNESRRINLPGAIARFVWMMAGSERLADIAFYEPKVKFFSDDGITVPGSSYGHRMIRPRPGLNQLEAVIDRIRSDTHTRRAAISIYHPGDAERDSKDIPCVFGLAYNVRDGGLHATTIMRSNNSLVLLPYNIFEFALVAEAVAAEVGVEFRSMTHTAISMHLYDSGLDDAKEVISNRPSADSLPSLPTPPEDPSPLEQIRTLVRMEADLRHSASGLSSAEIEQLIREAESDLHPYWNQFYLLLLLHAAREKSKILRSDPSEASVSMKLIRTALEEPWVSYLKDETLTTPLETDAPDNSGPRSSRGNGAQRAPGLFDTQPSELPSISRRTRENLIRVAQEYETETGDQISWREFAEIENDFGRKLAARDGSDISLDEFKKALHSVRQ